MSILAMTAALALYSEPHCEPALEHLAAVEAAVSAEDLRQAQRQADRAIDTAPDCVQSHMAMINVLQQRLSDAGGLSAMGLSRRYRRAVADTLALDPNHVGARSAEIGYLIHAPGIAGGDRERAEARIESLSTIDPLAGAQMGLELARANSDSDAMIAALQQLIEIAPDPSGARIELAYRFIRAERYEDAEASLLLWPEGTPQIEGERAYYRGALRVLGGFDLEAVEPFLTQALEVEREGDAAARASRDASIWGMIGGAREGLGDLDRAREAYTQALALNPENSRATEGLARLNAN